MPKIAELRKIGGGLWARLDIDLTSDDQPVHLLVQSEVDAIKKDVREACARAADEAAELWRPNTPGRRTAEAIAAAIRAMLI